MRRPAIIFDFGNVVAFFDYTRAASTLGARIGLSGEQLLDRLRTLGFAEMLKAYEAGRVPAEEFVAEVCRLVGLDVTYEEFAAAWSNIFTANESIAPLIAHLKSQGYTLVLGSNTNDLQAAHFRRQFADTLGHFDRLVLSFEVGEIKPSSAFYLACAEAAGASPGDCLFIDDLPENVEGADRAGLRGILYAGTPGLISDLAALGIEAPRLEEIPRDWPPDGSTGQHA